MHSSYNLDLKKKLNNNIDPKNYINKPVFIFLFITYLTCKSFSLYFVFSLLQSITRAII